METIWQILQIEETKDRAAIKKAYAALVKEYHPEEQPEEFLRVREAYEKALDHAKRGDEARAQPPRTPNPAEPENASTSENKTGNPRFGWNFAEENPFQESQGIRRFRELYTGKRRKDRALWSDYFVSDAFLEGYHEQDFTKLMLDTAMENREEYPPCREFLTELYIAYGLKAGYEQVVMDYNAAFNGIEHVIALAETGPLIMRFKGNDFAMIAGFSDYRNLLGLARKDSWDSDALLLLGKIIDHYMLSDISDKPIRNADQHELSWRHPKSIKLLTYFFAHANAPQQAYRMLWNHLNLETATNGKDKLLYGGLRDTVLNHMPEPKGRPLTDYREVTTAYSRRYRGDDMEQYRESADRFFEREDVQDALMDETYVEREVLHYWVTKSDKMYDMEKLEAFYNEHQDAPYADKILQKIQDWKKEHRIAAEYEEDEHSELVYGRFDFQRRAYVRYYLNTAFHQAAGMTTGISLAGYLREQMPYSPEWAKRLVSAEEGGFSDGYSAKMCFGENELGITFHRRYIEYLWNGAPCGPLFAWKDIVEIEDEAAFWLLLPITAAPFAEHPEVFDALSSRLSSLPVSEEDILVIADCITGKICRYEEDIQPICTFYAETEEQLYGCDIFAYGTRYLLAEDEKEMLPNLYLFEELNGEKHMLLNGAFHVPDREAAFAMGKRLLAEQITAVIVTAKTPRLPDRLLVKNQWNQPGSMEGEQVTDAALQELLEQYLSGTVNRLELAWGERSLVFINQKGRYACLYFDNYKSSWYAFIALPECMPLFRKDDVHVPFGFGLLPDYLVHPNLNRIKQNLNEILCQAANVLSDKKHQDWAPQVYRFDARLRYHLAKRLVGGYSAEQVYNPITDRFYIPEMPSSMAVADLEGAQFFPDRLHEEAVQEALADYMKGQLSKLILTWQFEGKDQSGETVLSKRHILLLQDGGSHQLLYMEEARKYLTYLVSDVQEYLNAEGRKYRKAVFYGKTVPAYLVHRDLRRIRDYMDLLLSQIQTPEAILAPIAEFSYCGGEYDEIWAKYF